MVLPGDAYDSSEAAEVKSVEPGFLVGEQSPALATIQKSAQHTGVVYCDLCLDGLPLLLV